MDGYLTEAFSREANAFIQRSAPFFLHLSYSAPHAPLQAAARFERQAVGIANQSRRRYAAMILAVDEGVGLLARTLRDKNLEHNTMVIFCTTNGGPIDSFYVSSRPFRGGKGELYEGGIHVPFAVSWPGRLAAGAKYYEPVSTLDIFATACGLAGAEIPADRKLDSVNLLPFLEGKSKGAPHERLFWRTGGGDAWAMREGRWKIVRQKDKPVELYDLNTDRGELRDLSPSSAEQIKEMWARVETWNADLVPPIFG